MTEKELELCWGELGHVCPALSQLYGEIENFNSSDCLAAQTFNNANGTGAPYFDAACFTILFLLVEAGEQIWWDEEEEAQAWFDSVKEEYDTVEPKITLEDI